MGERTRDIVLCRVSLLICRLRRFAMCGQARGLESCEGVVIAISFYAVEALAGCRSGELPAVRASALPFLRAIEQADTDRMQQGSHSYPNRQIVWQRTSRNSRQRPALN